MAEYTKKHQLIHRVEDNYRDFKHSLKGVSRERLFETAPRIAAVMEVYDYLKNEYEWDEENEIDFLLLFSDPLTIVADAWESRKADTLDDIDGALIEISFSDDVISEYPLATGVNDYIQYTGE